MARLKRVFIAGVPQHLVVRGVESRDMFLVDLDREFFLRCLLDSAANYGLKVHAYTLMSNHVHLLGTGECASSVPKAIQGLARRYVPYFNRRYERKGTLWETRYRSALVQSERYLVNCQRYIELNPVRAGMVRDPAEFPWSSHRHTAFGIEDPLVSLHEIFKGMGYEVRHGSAAYRHLFRQPMEPSLIERIRDCTWHGWGIGDDDFLEWASTLCDRRLTRKRSRRKGSDP
jgi:putative transposase